MRVGAAIAIVVVGAVVIGCRDRRGDDGARSVASETTKKTSELAPDAALVTDATSDTSAGDAKPVLMVLLDTKQLQAIGISVEEVTRSLNVAGIAVRSRYDLRGSNGDTLEEWSAVRLECVVAADGSTPTPQAIANLVVATVKGAPVRVRDVGVVQVTKPTP